ncbi:hypothetical protein BN1110_06289 [bacterium YEK0313]|nr:hypothetical protein BN1110_06289 [bacterium YEK0313]
MTISLKIVFDSSTAPARVQIVADLPPLTGSTKQVAWATDLREAATYDVAGAMARTANVVIGTMRADETETIAQTNTRLEEIFSRPGGNIMRAALQELFSVPDAKWWIDHRGGAYRAELNTMFRRLYEGGNHV